MISKKKINMRFDAIESRVASNEKITLASAGAAALSIVMSGLSIASNRSFKKVTAENSNIVRELVEELRSSDDEEGV